ncbi:methyltransferase domain-containing protein [Microbacteriaceae bacterium]|nr:methyltransferase domain-containing protein [Candidatus Saccharibacteria bacterium]
MKRLHQYSQYFIRNPRLVANLIAKSSVTNTDVVYDIGAGSGVISSQLAPVAKKVIAVEFEPNTVETLRKNMSMYDNVDVIEADALTLPLPEEPYKVFANIPFHLSSKIVRRFAHERPPVDVYLIVQKQFANKLLPEHDGFSSQLGMQVGVLFEIEIIKKLRRTDYWPHPNVDTVLLHFHYREKPLVPQLEYERYCRFIEKTFTNPDFFKSAYVRKFGTVPKSTASGLQLHDWVQFFSTN